MRRNRSEIDILRIGSELCTRNKGVRQNLFQNTSNPQTKQVSIIDCFERSALNASHLFFTKATKGVNSEKVSFAYQAKSVDGEAELYADGNWFLSGKKYVP